jgi:hypothetical protein
MTNSEFEDAIQEIDDLLKQQGIDISWRPLWAAGKFAECFGLKIPFVRQEVPATPGDYAGESLSAHIRDWYAARYGDRLKVHLGPGSIVILIKGDPWRMNMPRIYGRVKFVCDGDIKKYEGNSVVGSRNRLPVVNILNLIEGMPPGLAAALNDQELQEIRKQFFSGWSVLSKFQYAKTRPLVKEAMGDIETSIHCILSQTPQYGASKWASLQFVEKILKSYLVTTSGDFPKTHDLKKLAELASSQGIDSIPEWLLLKVQCSPSVRYGDNEVSLKEAVDANQSALLICEHICRDRQFWKKSQEKNDKDVCRADEPIYVNDVLYTLGLAQPQLNAWKKMGLLNTIWQEGKEYVSRRDFEKLANDGNVRASARTFFNWQIQEMEKERTEKNSNHKLKNLKTIARYRAYIKVLERMHASYRPHLDLLGDESALVAAYLLYYKVINLLYMSCTCLENSYWHSSVLLRPIDEAIHLAEYFIWEKATEKGKNHLTKWFRENRIIPHNHCREAESKFMDSLLHDGKMKTHRRVLDELYRKKSAMVHPTHHGIVEPYGIRIGSGWIMHLGPDYGPCSYQAKIAELTEFLLESAIHPAFQGFYLCFWDEMPLTEEHRQTCLRLDEEFLDIANQRNSL